MDAQTAGDRSTWKIPIKGIVVSALETTGRPDESQDADAGSLLDQPFMSALSGGYGS
jgi:hypothetical protein